MAKKKVVEEIPAEKVVTEEVKPKKVRTKPESENKTLEWQTAAKADHFMPFEPNGELDDQTKKVMATITLGIGSDARNLVLWLQNELGEELTGVFDRGLYEAVRGRQEGLGLFPNGIVSATDWVALLA